MLILSLSLSEKLANALLVIRLRSDIFMRLASQSSFAPASFSAMHSPSLYVLTAACIGVSPFAFGVLTIPLSARSSAAVI